MGQKVHPTGFRLGVIKKHNALWYANVRDDVFGNSAVPHTARTYSGRVIYGSTVGACRNIATA